MDESLLVVEWFRTTLDGNAVGVADRVYEEKAPPTLNTWPAVVVNVMSDVPKKGNAGRRLMQRQIIEVKVVGKETGPTKATIGPISSAIDALLDNRHEKYQGIYLECQLDSRPRIPAEQVGNDWWVYLASLWRVYVHTA